MGMNISRTGAWGIVVAGKLRVVEMGLRARLGICGARGAAELAEGLEVVFLQVAGAQWPRWRGMRRR